MARRGMALIGEARQEWRGKEWTGTKWHGRKGAARIGAIRKDSGWQEWHGIASQGME